MPSHIELYRYIIDTIEIEGRRPTFREIMAHYGFAGTNAVSTHIKTLEKYGYVKRKVFPHGCSDTFDILKLPDGSPFRGFRAVQGISAGHCMDLDLPIKSRHVVADGSDTFRTSDVPPVPKPRRK